MSELKALMRNRVSCCAKSGANGESKLWQSALDEIEALEGSKNEAIKQALFKVGAQINEETRLSKMSKSFAVAIVLNELGEIESTITQK
tara:strand:- start:1283 stop:1549 length:267 start_codon:yes stop_codon:yes gene_type:complete